jgi:hypothetical protein
MAKVKIFLEDDETLQDAEESLLKAMDHHNSGEVHSHHQFQDPAMQSVAHRMEEAHKKIQQEMLQEINEALDRDYSDGYK